MYKSKVRTTWRSIYADVIPTEDEEQEALFIGRRLKAQRSRG